MHSPLGHFGPASGYHVSVCTVSVSVSAYIIILYYAYIEHVLVHTAIRYQVMSIHVYCWNPYPDPGSLNVLSDTPSLPPLLHTGIMPV